MLHRKIGKNNKKLIIEFKFLRRNSNKLVHEQKIFSAVRGNLPLKKLKFPLSSFQFFKIIAGFTRKTFILSCRTHVRNALFEHCSVHIIWTILTFWCWSGSVRCAWEFPHNLTEVDQSAFIIAYCLGLWSVDNYLIIIRIYWLFLKGFQVKF